MTCQNLKFSNISPITGFEGKCIQCVCADPSQHHEGNQQILGGDEKAILHNPEQLHGTHQNLCQDA
jgi:hypothetical protein